MLVAKNTYVGMRVGGRVRWPMWGASKAVKFVKNWVMMELVDKN